MICQFSFQIQGVMRFSALNRASFSQEFIFVQFRQKRSVTCAVTDSRGYVDAPVLAKTVLPGEGSMKCGTDKDWA